MRASPNLVANGENQPLMSKRAESPPRAHIHRTRKTLGNEPAAKSSLVELPGRIPKQSKTRKTVAAFRKGKKRDYTTWRGRVGVHVEVDSIELKLLRKTILTSLPGWEMIDHYDVVRLWLPFDESALSGGEESDGGSANVRNFDAATPEVYVFSFGAVVFWNFPNEDFEQEFTAKYILSNKLACGDPNNPAAIESANDGIEFCYDDVFKTHRDVVYLSTRDPGEKLAVSFAFAKSALLSIFEWRLERTIERNAHIPEELAETGHIKMSRKEVSQEIGRLYLVKHGINLETSIQDTPEEFWEDDRFQEQYNKSMGYFDIMQRLNLVNNRLRVIEDLHQVLIESIQNHHGVFLEWIIIILIVVEVILEFGRYWAY